MPCLPFVALRWNIQGKSSLVRSTSCVSGERMASLYSIGKKMESFGHWGRFRSGHEAGERAHTAT